MENQNRICKNCDHLIKYYDWKTESGGFICIAPITIYGEDIAYVMNLDQECELFKKKDN